MDKRPLAPVSEVESALKDFLSSVRIFGCNIRKIPIAIADLVFCLKDREAIESFYTQTTVQFQTKSPALVLGRPRMDSKKLKMANSRHQINKLRIEMVYPNEALAKRSHQIIQDAFPKEILPLITEILDELALEGYVLEYDKLTVDFGELNLRFLKEELKEKLTEKLNFEVQKERQKATSSLTDEHPTLHTQSGQKRELLLYFLLHGRLPWWAYQQTVKLEILLEELVQKQPAEIRKLFNELGTNELAIKRLTHRFQETLIFRMITIAWGKQLPSLSLFLGQFYKNIPQTKQQKQAKTHFLLSSILQLQRNHDNSENQLYQTITTAFFKAFPLGKNEENRFLLKLRNSSAGHVKKAFRFQHSDEEILKHFLQYGSIPYWAQIEKQKTILELWRNISKSAPLDLATWLKKGSTSIFQRIAFQIPKKEQAQFLAALPKPLKERLEKGINAKKNKEKKPEKDQKVTEMDLLLYFLFEGHLPWWAAEVKQQEPRKIFVDLLHQCPNYILAELVGLRQEEAVKKRLLTQFDSDTFDLFLEKIQPNLFGFIQTIRQAFAQLEKPDVLPSSAAAKLSALSRPILLNLLLDNYQKKLTATTLLQGWIEKLGDQLQVQMAMLWKALQQVSLANVVEGKQRFNPLAAMAKKEFEHLGTTDNSIVNPQEKDFERTEEWRKTRTSLLRSLGLRLQKNSRQADFFSLIVEGQANFDQHNFYNKIALASLENPNRTKKILRRLIQNPNAKLRLAEELDGRSLAVVLSLFAQSESKQFLTLLDDFVPLLDKLLPWSKKVILSFYKAEMLSALLYFENASALQVTEEIVEAIVQKIGGGMSPFVKKLQAAAVKESGLQFITITLVEALALHHLESMKKENEVHSKATLERALGLSSTNQFNTNLVEFHQNILSLKTDFGPASKTILREFIQQEKTRNLLADQLEDKTLDLIIDLLHSDLSAKIRSLFYEIFIPLKRLLQCDTASLELEYKRGILQSIAQNEHNLSLELALEKLLELLAQQKGISKAKLLRGLQALLSNDRAKYSNKISLLVQQLAKDSKAVVVRKPRPKPTPLPKARKRKSKAKKAPEEIFIKNAGLVILRPFFGHFFTAMGLKLSKKEDAHRAAHLLQYVAYKTTENAEEDLVLNKLLCGIPLNEPIPPSIEITEKEQQICEQIIQAATQNWSAMKNTENDNFRVTFLHRSGKLIDRGDEWFLSVERQTFDFLLETIPWGFKMIMMNHMDKMITVEWK